MVVDVVEDWTIEAKMHLSKLKTEAVLFRDPGAPEPVPLRTRFNATAVDVTVPADYATTLKSRSAWKFLEPEKDSPWHQHHGKIIISLEVVEGGRMVTIRVADGLRWVGKTKLLGLTIDSELTFHHHMQRVVDNFSLKMNFLRHLSGKSFGCNTCTLRTLYLTYVLPTYTYALSVYGPYLLRSTSPLVATLERLPTDGLEMPSEDFGFDFGFDAETFAVPQRRDRKVVAPTVQHADLAEKEGNASAPVNAARYPVPVAGFGLRGGLLELAYLLEVCTDLVRGVGLRLQLRESGGFFTFEGGELRGPPRLVRTALGVLRDKIMDGTAEAGGNAFGELGVGGRSFGEKGRALLIQPKHHLFPVCPFPGEPCKPGGPRLPVPPRNLEGDRVVVGLPGVQSPPVAYEAGDAGGDGYIRG
ncbi:hypothetical protein DIPPA_07219 [Diplonema papillatum]|nr:hypothetical protein DIPPA_07219 [Diplonema papillatum]